MRAHSRTRTAWRCLPLGACVLALVCLHARQALAFKPTPEFGHVGIIREAITPITRMSSGGETMRFSARAIEEIIDASAGVDEPHTSRGEFFVPKAHCDDETLLECSQLIITLKNDIIANLSSEGRVGSFARTQVGRALHTLEDFYAHSNWVVSPGPGNTGINPALGRSVVPAPLGATPTCDFSGGMLTGAGLTSITTGYFRFVSRWPAGKCDHGLLSGQGIHKDEPSRPFFTEARAVAVLGTQDLINQILDAPGVAGNDEAIRAFMDIRGTRGFVIDDTCSMGPDIAGVRSSVQQIINRLDGTKFAPDGYLMVRFGDPDVGAPFTTPNPAALLAAVNALSPGGGGDCPEMSQTALLSAISGATGGGHLYLYSDASAKDAALAGNVSAAANAKKININYVITGSCSPVDPAYTRVAQETGGQVFFIHRSEVGAMFHLIEPSLQGDLRPMLVVNGQFTGNAKNFDVPVDSTVTRVTFSTSADALPSVRLVRPSGDEVLTTDPDVVYTELLTARIYTVDSPAAGLWSLSLNGTGNFSLSVLGNSPIDFADLAFVELRGRPAHEGLFRLNGQPILGEEELVRARIFGPYASVAFERVALDGTVLGPLALALGGHPDAASDEYVGRLVLPAQPFRVYARGVDESGAAFRRAFAPTFRGQTVKVEPVTVGASLPPAVTTSIEFRVTNLGAAGSFRITATDDARFVTEVVPSVISLASAASAVVNVRLFVPDGTTRQFDALIAFARSTSNPDIGNSALVGLPVVSPDILVTKTHAPELPLVGQDLTYTITVRNNGPGLATGVTVEDALPPEVTFVSAAASQGGCVGMTLVTCDLGSLSSGSQASVTIVVRPTVTGVIITNTVSVASDQSDPAPGNNQATDTTPLAVVPQALVVDRSAGVSSDGNGIFEPGETVAVEPAWRSISGSPVTPSGMASSFTGPAGATYTLLDSVASYGTIAPGATANCSATPDCYSMSVAAPERPSTHWDSLFTETPSTLDVPKIWKLHLGESFTDVSPPSALVALDLPSAGNPFYAKIETLLHSGITTGCTPTTYCPGDPVNRAQMVIFIARALLEGTPVPQSGTVNGQPYNCSAGGISLFTDVLPTDIYCRHAHYLAGQNVTLGCSATQFCGSANVTRDAMAAFIARALVAPGGGAAVPAAYGPDPVTGLSYNCNVGSPDINFSDVPATNSFCKHVHYLWALGIVAGCGGDQYCPTGLVTRDAMAKFLANAFKLVLYGP